MHIVSSSEKIFRHRPCLLSRNFFPKTSAVVGNITGGVTVFGQSYFNKWNSVKFRVLGHHSRAASC
jgi:hypothetical protein